MKARRPISRKSAPAVPVEPEDVLIKRARRLPLSGPGIVTTVPLTLLPAYMQIHNLEPFTRDEIRKRAQQGIRKPDGVLLVKRLKKADRYHEPNHS